MNTELLLTVIAAGLYVIASVLAVTNFLRPSPSRERDPLMIAAVAGLCLASALACRGFRTGRCPVFGAFEATAWYALSVTGACLYVELRHRTPALSAFLLPYVSLLVVVGGFHVSAEPSTEPVLQHILLGIHVASAFVGYGIFTLESFLGVIYLVQDRNLKRKHFGPLSQRLPSLEALDHLMVELIGIAFLLFSLSIGIGVFQAHLYNWGTQWVTDCKVVATGATWVVYAILFYLRMSADRHGRKVAWVAVGGFLLVLLAFLGVHMVADSLHSFAF